MYNVYTVYRVQYPAQFASSSKENFWSLCKKVKLSQWKMSLGETAVSSCITLFQNTAQHHRSIRSKLSSDG